MGILLKCEKREKKKENFKCSNKILPTFSQINKYIFVAMSHQKMFFLKSLKIRKFNLFRFINAFCLIGVGHFYYHS